MLVDTPLAAYMSMNFNDEKDFTELNIEVVPGTLHELVAVTYVTLPVSYLPLPTPRHSLDLQRPSPLTKNYG